MVRVSNNYRLITKLCKLPKIYPNRRIHKIMLVINKESMGIHDLFSKKIKTHIKGLTIKNYLRPLKFYRNNKNRYDVLV